MTGATLETSADHWELHFFFVCHVNSRLILLNVFNKQRKTGQVTLPCGLDKQEVLLSIPGFIMQHVQLGGSEKDHVTLSSVLETIT